MTFLIGFSDAIDFLPFIIAIIIFVVIFGIVIGRIIKQASDSKRGERSSERPSQYIDGNGRTQTQRDYIAKLRAKQAQKNIDERDRRHQRNISESDSHGHSGKAEHYDPIVGSLGEVNDEGCGELDGVRLVEHDEAYCDDDSHFAVTNYSELQRAIVLGEVINNPRFKRRGK